MSEQNITYILGAGASCKSQPLVSNMRERMNLLLQMLNPKSYCNQLLNIEIRSNTKILYERYKDIVHESFKHYTPDTYAKKLWLTDKHETLNIFKEFLNLYFIFEQNFSLNHLITEKPEGRYARINLPSDKIYEIAKEINSYNLNTSITKLLFKNIKQDDYELNKSKFFTNLITNVDYRYDVFFATLLQQNFNFGINPKLELPHHINIISWNYDNQFEISYRDYGSNQNYSEIHETLRINKEYEEDTSNIIKLNGYCSIYNTDTNEQISFTGHLKNLIINIGDTTNHINFAWEKRDRNFGTINKIVEKTDIFIVIGYSFPNFNRDVDKDLFEKINQQLIKKKNSILIQVPENTEYLKIKERIQTIKKFDDTCFKHISDADQFYIPL